MDQKPITVVGIYPTRAAVETAVEAFRDAGFKNGDISIVVPEKASTEDLFAQGATRLTEDSAQTIREDAVNEGPLEWLEEAGPAKIAGGAPFIVAGPIAQTLDGVDSQSPIEGLALALNTLGVPRGGTDEYAGKVVKGRALLSVHCESAEEAVMARRLYGDLGGTDIYSTTGQVESDTAKRERSVAHWAGRR
jgi:hypothetical protein